jgi:ketosteroid isomerase-like protein
MARPAGFHHINLAWLLICGILVGGKANGQQPLDLDAVKAANQAFYTALSTGDVPAMRKVWSSDPDPTNIGPGSKAVAVGWDAIGKAFEATRDAFPDLKATMEPRIKIVGAIAWATGVEQTQRKDKTGTVISSANLATNIFQKQDGNWLMVHHHASRMPQ